MEPNPNTGSAKMEFFGFRTGVRWGAIVNFLRSANRMKAGFLLRWLKRLTEEAYDVSEFANKS